MKVAGFIYATIRRSTDDGREWIDMNGASGVPDNPRSAAKILDDTIPAWATANPFQRVARIRMEEGRMNRRKWDIITAFRSGWNYGQANGEVSARTALMVLDDALVESDGATVQAFCQGSCDGAVGETFRLYTAMSPHE